MSAASGLPIRFCNVTKRYGTYTVLDSFNFFIEAGEFLTILGASGSGKSTILNSLAGFVSIDAGLISVADKPVHHLPPERRNIGMVFQDYSLFPHMTVAENVGFPLRMRGVRKKQVGVRVDEALAAVRLDGYNSRLPRELSGGQQQRVALARAISFSPSILLMDEPLGALDLKLREALQFEIKEIHRRIGCTVVYVTHDQREAMAMSDRIVVLRSGKIEQAGSSEEIYNSPHNRFVADFIGQTNFIGAEYQPDGTLRLADIELSFKPASAIATGGPLFLNLRPEMLMLQRAGPGHLEFEVVIQDSVFQGDAIFVSATTQTGRVIYFREPRTKAGRHLKHQKRTWLSFDPSRATIVPDDKN